MQRLYSILLCAGTLAFLAAHNLTHSPTRWGVASSRHNVAMPAAAQSSRSLPDYGRLPLAFERNQGQTDRQVRFLARGIGYNLFLTSNEAVLTLRTPHPRASRSTRSASHFQVKRDPAFRQASAGQRSKPNTSVLRMKLSGANTHPQIAGLEQQEGVVNYFIGNDPAKWRTHIPTYSRVQYKNVYPGIDMIYYGNRQQLEYDWVVAPGADPHQIQMAVKGAQKTSLTAAGDLKLETACGEVVEHAPVVYQQVDGVRKPVQGRLVLRSGPRSPNLGPRMKGQQEQRIGFEVGAYDPTRPLVIDPVLVYSTYLGGSGYDSASGVAVDSYGNAYVAGATGSADFPTHLPYQSSNKANTTDGYENAFVYKMNASGTGLIYSTYLGGSTEDDANGIAVDSSGDAYVTGLTESKDFPTQSALYSKLPSTNGAAFITELNSTGSALVYSTYLGGSNGAEATGIAVDSSGNAYVTGGTGSTDFPTKNAYQSANNGKGNFGDGNAFVTKINSGGASLAFSTYLGGSGGDTAYAIAVDSSNEVCIAGDSNSTDFPVHNAYQSANQGEGDCFVAKFTAAGTALVYATYLGGSLIDHAHAIAVDSSGDAYVVGDTNSTNFPNKNAYQSSNQNTGGVSTGFVTKFSSTGGLVYSTYLGGSGDQIGNGESCDAIAVDSSGDAYITGSSSSPNFPTKNAIQSTNGGSGNAFITELNSSGSSLVSSTFLGGTGGDVGLGIVLDSNNNIYVAGETRSTDFPTQSPFQPVTHTSLAANSFVVRIGDYNWQTVDIAVGSDDQARLLWTNTNRSAALWNVNTSGDTSGLINMGPYADYTVQAIAAGSDGLTRLLWNKNDRTAAFWILNANNSFSSGYNFGPYAGWDAIDVTVGSDDNARLLWTKSDGTAGVWTVNGKGKTSDLVNYGPYAGWTARSISAGADGLTRLLWTKSDGSVALWLLNADNSYNNGVNFSGTTGWNAIDMAVGADNNARLLWVKSDGTVGVWTVNNKGQTSNLTNFGPYAGWNATRIAAGSDGYTRMLWFKADGTQALWLLKANNSYDTAASFGPY